MPQKLNLTTEQLQQAQQAKSGASSEMIPTLEGAKSYLAYVDYHGTPVLCIFDKGTWRATTKEEIMRMIL